MPISDSAIASAARSAGFTGNALVTAVAVALAESGGRPDATNRNTNGSTDFGLWQINSIHADKLRTGSWSNPSDNARMAYAVYAEAGKSFRPWVAYTTGRHLAYVGRARKAAGSAPVGSVLPPAQPTGAPLPFVPVVSGGFFVRAAMFVAGAALITWALLRMTELDNKAAGAAVSGAKLAITRGLVK